MNVVVKVKNSSLKKPTEIKNVYHCDMNCEKISHLMSYTFQQITILDALRSFNDYLIGHVETEASDKGLFLFAEFKNTFINICF